MVVLYYISIFATIRLYTIRIVTIFKTETFIKWKQDTDTHTCVFNFQMGTAQYDLFVLSEKYNGIFLPKVFFGGSQ